MIRNYLHGAKNCSTFRLKAETGSSGPELGAFGALLQVSSERRHVEISYGKSTCGGCKLDQSLISVSASDFCVSLKVRFRKRPNGTATTGVRR